MPFEPDIVVTETGHHRVNLVVDVKTTLPDLQQTELGLKKYMYLVQCPTGLLITPDRLWLYQDGYTADHPNLWNSLVILTSHLCGKIRRQSKRRDSRHLYSVGWKTFPDSEPNNFPRISEVRSGNISYQRSCRERFGQPIPVSGGERFRREQLDICLRRPGTSPKSIGCQVA